MAGSKRFNNRELTALLREELDKAHDIATEGGGILTKGEAIIQLIMRKALGWDEVLLEEDETGNVVERKVVHKPEAWALQLIYDRCEGKTPQALPDVKSGITAAKKVRDLTVARVNEMSKAATEPKLSGPPTYKGNRKNGSDT